MKSTAWNVYLNGRLIDTVWDQASRACDVKDSLVNHDGYSIRIKVCKRR